MNEKAAVRESLSRVKEYIPGKDIEYVKKRYGLDRVVKLASNENLYGASPKAIDAFKDFKDLHLYPPPQPEELIERISKYTGVEESKIVIGSGIDGILEGIFNIFLEKGDSVSISPPTFPYYITLATIHDAKIERLERDESFNIKVSNSPKSKITLICSPNNPTGNLERGETVREIVEESQGIIFIDEAYVEFSSSDLLEFTEYENVILARTFSKAFGLANLRIGYAIMPEWVKKEYLKVTTPFPVSTPAIKAACAALDDLEYMKSTVERIKRDRERVFKELLNFGAEVYPSEANFLFMRVTPSFCDEMMKRGVIVRDCSSFVGCRKGDVRVSIGRTADNEYFLEKAKEILGQDR
ncbi:histidinol-phosphate transaminase [Archaeoglobales archaeon]|nr:MAG: histidinol-phosphate transaminase [Archaeoglobales archaeon]